MIVNFGETSLVDQARELWNRTSTAIQTGAQVVNDPKSIVQSVVFESALSPRLQIDKPLASKPGDKPKSNNGLLKIFRPKFTVQLVNGQQVVIAPYGEPGASKWPYLQAGGIVFAGLAGYGLYSLIRGK